MGWMHKRRRPTQRLWWRPRLPFRPRWPKARLWVCRKRNNLIRCRPSERLPLRSWRRRNRQQSSLSWRPMPLWPNPLQRQARRMRLSGGWRRTTPEPVSRMHRRPRSRPRPSKTTLIRLCAGCGRTGRAARSRPLLRLRSLAFRCHLIRSRLAALSDFYASR
jgi:hypothetical protein